MTPEEIKIGKEYLRQLSRTNDWAMMARVTELPVDKKELFFEVADHFFNQQARRAREE